MNRGESEKELSIRGECGNREEVAGRNVDWSETQVVD